MNAAAAHPVVGHGDREADERAGTARGPTRTSKVLRGSVWTLGAYGASILLRLGTNLLLAHLLFPAAFALLSLAGVLIQGLKMFSDIGIGPSIIRSERGNDPTFLNTAWTLQIVRGFVLFMVACALAWPMAVFYADPRLLWIVPVSSMTLIIGGFGSTALATNSREIRVGRATLLDLGERFVQTLIMAGWAVLSPTVWAILIGTIVSRLLFVAGSHRLLSGNRDRLAWDRGALRELLKFGKWIFISTAITFFAMQIDRIILGRVSTEMLGVYSVALTLAGVSLELANRLTGSILFPALSSIARDNRTALHDRLLRARAVILSGAFFATLGVVLAGPWFFQFLYDFRYSHAVWMAPITAGCVWVSLLQTSADRALLAVGDSRSIAFSNAANLVGTIAFCLLGYWLYELPGFVAGVGLGNVAGHVVVQIAMARHGLPVHMQDARYTVALAVVVAADSVLRESIGQRFPDVPAWGIAAIVSGSFLMTTALWTASRMYQKVFSK